MIRTVNIGRSLFTPKVQTVGSVTDFLGVSPALKTGLTLGRTSFLAGASLGIANLMTNSLQQASEAVPVLGVVSPVLGTAGITSTIIKACDPIIQLIQGVSYPVGFIMICAGFLVIMTGNRQKGLAMIKWAALGYIGMQFAPAIMAIIVDVGRAIGK